MPWVPLSEGSPVEVLMEKYDVPQQPYREWLEERGVPYQADCWERAFLHLYETEPFYCFFLGGAKREYRDNMETAAAVSIVQGQLNLYLNRWFGSTFSTEQAAAVLKHEAGHIILQHLQRYREGFATRAQQYAAELCINGGIRGLPEWTVQPKAYRIRGQVFLPHLTLHQYEELLSEDATMRERPTSGGHEWKDCDEDCDAVRDMIQQAVDKAVMKAGSMPGELVDALRALKQRKEVPFGRLFRQKVGRSLSSKQRSSVLRLSRRTGMPPGKTRSYRIKVLVAQDDSGSVPEYARLMLRGEVLSLVKSGLAEVFFQRFTMERTGQLEALDDYDAARKMSAQCMGGTDFNDVCLQADEIGADLLIICTDGEAPTPKPPKFADILWVLTPGGTKHPIGQTVMLSDK